MITEKQIEAGRQVLRKYLLPDCLKPQYDGMTLYEIAKRVLREAEINPMEEEHDCKLREKGFCDCAEEDKSIGQLQVQHFGSNFPPSADNLARE